jgi:O-methyltransferase
MDDRLAGWMAALEARHLAELTFSEVSRALRALSSAYVERRQKLARGAALDGAGKRAAFALFYGPLHYLLLRHIVSALPGATSGMDTLVDLGCGTGASGAAWASVCVTPPRVVGIDRHPWAVQEAAATYHMFGLSAFGATSRQGDMAMAKLPRPASILAAFALNELADADRDALLTRLVERASSSTGGERVLIVEPIAGFVARWWNRWQKTFEAAGGRADEWRIRVELPAIVTKLDKAAGLNHRELTGRSLYIDRS